MPGPKAIFPYTTLCEVRALPLYLSVYKSILISARGRSDAVTRAPAARHQSTRAALKPLHQTPEAAGVAPDVDVGSMPAARDEATLALRQCQEGSALTPTGPPVPKPFTVNTASCHRGANSFEIHCHSKAKRCRVEGLGGRGLGSEVV